MTKGDLAGITILGRPLKPLALGISIIMLSYTVFNVANQGVLADLLLGHVLAVVSAMAFALLTAGWWARSQSLAEWGLLAAAATFTLRASFVLLVGGALEERVYLNVGMVAISGGAYLLERWDER